MIGFRVRICRIVIVVSGSHSKNGNNDSINSNNCDNRNIVIIVLIVIIVRTVITTIADPSSCQSLLSARIPFFQLLCHP